MIPAHQDRGLWIGWLNPVPFTNGRYPVVSHEFEGGQRYLPDGSLNYATHLGLDLMFPRVSTDPTGPATDVAIPRHGNGWIMWPGVRIMAAGPGHIWEAKETHLGHSVLVDHGKVGGVGLLSFYQHMTGFAQPWKRGDAVFPGMPLGIMGGDPSNPPHLRHLHLEIWLPDGKPQAEWPTDPAPYLAMWSKI